jgi:NAD(P)-dependent dehydrogenase (short-subunit alcohol dehydrogenase family)
VTTTSGSSALERFSLKGKTALVTGASPGIGAAIAKAFADAGADVALAARSRGALEDLARSIEAQGGTAMAIPCDVTIADEVAACVETAEQGLGRIAVLVNNAGGPVFNAPFLEIREQGWQKLIDLNLTSVFRFCQQVGAGMIARRSGSVINIASVVADRPWPALAAYSAAKAGVLSLTQTLAQEWAGVGVRVNAICPGWVMTGINRAFLDDDRSLSLAIESVPLARCGEPEDIVGVAIWLASDASGYVTGANIAVDGGLAIAISEDWRALRVPGKD